MLIDLETRLVGRLVADDVLAGNLGTRLPRDYAERLPYGTLQRVPGSRFIDSNTKTLEAVRLQVNTYAAKGQDQAALLAWDALATAIAALEGTGIGPVDPPDADPDVFLTEVDVAPPWWYPDPDTEEAGYMGNLTIFARGYALVG